MPTSNNSSLLFIYFPLAVPLKPQVIVSFRPRVFNVVGIYSTVVTCCAEAIHKLPLPPTPRRTHQPYYYMHSQALRGAQMLLSCISVYTTWFSCPHVSLNCTSAAVQHANIDVFMHHTSETLITLNMFMGAFLSRTVETHIKVMCTGY